MTLNTILAQMGDFIARKIKEVKSYVDGIATSIRSEIQSRYDGIMSRIDGEMSGVRSEIESREAAVKEEIVGRYDACMNRMTGMDQRMSGMDDRYGQARSEIAAQIEKTETDCNEYTDTAIANLIDGAPETLDTIKELADAFSGNREAIDTLSDLAGNHRHDNATAAADGFMSKEDKAFLDGVGNYAEFVAAFNAQVGEGSIFFENAEDAA